MKSPAVALALAVSICPTLAGCGGSPTSARTSTSPSTCIDARGDAISSDLIEVRLTVTGDNLQAQWRFAETVETEGLRGYYVNFSSPDGTKTGQLGLKLDGGRPIGKFVFDLVANKQTNVTSLPAIQGDKVWLDFPLSALEPFGRNLKWYATTTVDGSDVDRCPNVDAAADPPILTY